MPTASDVERITAAFFEKKEILFEGCYPVTEKGQKFMKIHCWGKRGRFIMKMDAELNLYCFTLKTKQWAKIENY